VNITDIVIELESVNVAAFNKDSNNWRVDVILSSNNNEFNSTLKFVLESTAWSYATSPAFNHTLTVSLTIPDSQVSRWWPNGFGNQPLYNLTVSNNDQLIGRRVIGFRTVELIQESYGGGIAGNSFYFLINSKPIYVKGSNWIPADAFQERITNQTYERLLRSAQVANMNMLRVWGGGIYEHQVFYELADQLGIMLWHDFMFACSL
jgi:beta-mannosidase